MRVEARARLEWRKACLSEKMSAVSLEIRSNTAQDQPALKFSERR